MIEATLPATLPIDHMLAVGVGRISLREIAMTYGRLGLLAPDDPPDIAAARNWLLTPETAFASSVIRVAADAATRHGKFVAELGTLLATGEFRGKAGYGVADLPGLAALGVVHLLDHRGRFNVRPCDNCAVPFVASGRARYCRRAAVEPGVSARDAVVLQLDTGRPWRTCQDVAKARDFHDRKKKEDGDGEHR